MCCLFVQALTAAFTSVISDVLAQYLTGTPLSNLNYTSIRNQLLIGLVFRGPVVHYWFIVLEEVKQRTSAPAPRPQSHRHLQPLLDTTR